jgi:hypothetical protein
MTYHPRMNPRRLACTLAFLCACACTSDSKSSGSAAVELAPGQALPSVANADKLSTGAPELLPELRIDQQAVKLGSKTLLELGPAAALAPSAIEDHQIPAVYEALTAVAGSSKRLLVVGDERVPFATLSPILYTAVYAGFERADVLVKTESGELGVIPVRLRRRAQPHGDDPKQKTLDLRVAIIEHGYLITVGASKEPRGDQRPTIPVDDAGQWDTAELDAKISAFKAEKFVDYDRTMMVLPEPRISLGTIASTLATLRGSNCAELDHPECHFGEILLDLTPVAFTRAMYRAATARPVPNNPPVGKLGNTGLLGMRPRVAHGEPIVDGSVAVADIGRVVRAHRNDLQACYDQGLSKDPELAGDLRITFAIASSGEVTSSTVAESSVANEAVPNCVAEAINGWTFPKPRDGGTVEVSYPFTLEP